MEQLENFQQLEIAPELADCCVSGIDFDWNRVLHAAATAQSPRLLVAAIKMGAKDDGSVIFKILGNFRSVLALIKRALYVGGSNEVPGLSHLPPSPYRRKKTINWFKSRLNITLPIHSSTVPRQPFQEVCNSLSNIMLRLVLEMGAVNSSSAPFVDSFNRTAAHIAASQNNLFALNLLKISSHDVFDRTPASILEARTPHLKKISTPLTPESILHAIANNQIVIAPFTSPFPPSQLLQNLGTVSMRSIPYGSGLGIEDDVILETSNISEAFESSGYFFEKISNDQDLGHILSQNWSDILQPPIAKQLYFGGINTGAPPHFHKTAINLLLQGTKRWYIWPKSQSIYSTERKHKTPDPPIIFLQKAGQAVLIPGGVGHAVDNLENVVGMAIEFETPLNTLEF